MSSSGIELWVKRAPESWAKLAKKGKGKQTFEQFKKKFFEGAEQENKAYLKDYITDAQLRDIYVNGAGGQDFYNGGSKSPAKPQKTVLTVKRGGKEYSRASPKKWDKSLGFTLKLAAQSKPKSADYYKYLDILIAQGKTRQAAVKKIQRTRRGNDGKK